MVKHSLTSMILNFLYTLQMVSETLKSEERQNVSLLDFLMPSFHECENKSPLLRWNTDACSPLIVLWKHLTWISLTANQKGVQPLWSMRSNWYKQRLVWRWMSSSAEKGLLSSSAYSSKDASHRNLSATPTELDTFHFSYSHHLKGSQTFPTLLWFNRWCTFSVIYL